MGTYNIPRNTKGEGRLFYIFSYKALVYTAVGFTLGIPFYLLFKAINMATIGAIIVITNGVLGFSIATFKVPNAKAFKLTKDTGGENIDDIILRFIKFKMKKNRIYITKEEEE